MDHQADQSHREEPRLAATNTLQEAKNNRLAAFRTLVQSKSCQDHSLVDLSNRDLAYYQSCLEARRENLPAEHNLDQLPLEELSNPAAAR